MSPNDTKITEPQKCGDRFGGRIPEPLRDEVAQLYERGYSQADIFAEGVRHLSDTEGIWRRRRDFAVGSNPIPSEEMPVPAHGP